MTIFWILIYYICIIYIYLWPVWAYILYIMGIIINYLILTYIYYYYSQIYIIYFPRVYIMRFYMPEITISIMHIYYISGITLYFWLSIRHHIRHPFLHFIVCMSSKGFLKASKSANYTYQHIFISIHVLKANPLYV